ncbi:50S ribosomal protein L6 [Oceanotoga sp. DSM 15011]|jgi:large subunit ribosomal protein L6|uniref:Large ribosomal subunit protein uL6 n=1 Tax=Oceanotoga teriensis TaxID=515440 RepID=A0AA45C663_9BACT|nr:MULTISPECIES: 50S ribosomal protein L6 [Oceanotoga]MDN5343343.1 large subunit ribosomal protein [Oceanotoga sp.]MDO7975633.1 50S ribosomal protein L6 [Oceanotoga teriensis]PWJ90618.1 LSU ribosomal protein L6P [Oceanotoga teriensis]UYO99861.1 50S ribosomal protein L6 [Oceanotoga sp. DSM 15011]
MSRIADKPTVIPQGVEINVEANKVTVKGKKGELNLEFRSEVTIDINENELMVGLKEETLKRASDKKRLTALRGTYTALIRNMITGVTEGFSKELEIVGIGYRAAKQGKQLVLNLGYSHPIEYDAPEGIEIDVPAPNKIIIKGSDKYMVGEVAAIIRKMRKPNAYSGKGVKYIDEVIIKKEGKKV